ncbi:hypothetical protein Tco_1029275 [Tanacetum coccineum]|uniref:Retrovirus-related Pol polyprotein from transposon TNT 1-94-like beta-barrel domain-containing protein n=1 Tax=Tanacetum coccineum TaxID=301880 RepID=A0ABQ5G3I2_9ASTR
MDERKRHFARLRAEKKRRKTLTKAQTNNQMCTYLKNMGGFTQNQLKNKSFKEIHKAFDKTIRNPNSVQPEKLKIVLQGHYLNVLVDRLIATRFLEEHVLNYKSLQGEELACINMFEGTKKQQGNPQIELQDKGVIDSGCSRHMTRNKSYLSDYEEIDGGFVAFGGNSKRGKDILSKKDEINSKTTKPSTEWKRTNKQAKDVPYSTDHPGPRQKAWKSIPDVSDTWRMTRWRSSNLYLAVHVHKSQRSRFED